MKLNKSAKSMLEVLVSIDDETISNQAKMLLKGNEPENLKLFMKAVIQGDFSCAIARANYQQYHILKILPNHIEKKNWGIIHILNN